MTNDLRVLARLERDRPFRRVHATDAVRLAIANLGQEIADAAASVSYELLPEVRGDARQITALFQVLIASAVRCRGPRRLQVRISADVADDGWRFTVADNGIPRTDLSRELSTAAMDLAICRIIVERHGGRIWLEPGTFAGSLVRFTLPAG